MLLILLTLVLTVAFLLTTVFGLPVVFLLMTAFVLTVVLLFTAVFLLMTAFVLTVIFLLTVMFLSTLTDVPVLALRVPAPPGMTFVERFPWSVPDDVPGPVARPYCWRSVVLWNPTTPRCVALNCQLLNPPLPATRLA